MITYGYLQTAFAAAQLLGGPVYGRLGDMFGSRAVLVLAHACGFFMYFTIAMATTPVMLFFSRVPGLLMHGAQGKLIHPFVVLLHASHSYMQLRIYLNFSID